MTIFMVKIMKSSITLLTKTNLPGFYFIYHLWSFINWHYPRRFMMTDPIIFRSGDIVEVQSTISVVPVKKDRYRMVINLRALAMLDGGPSMVRRITQTEKKLILRLTYRKRIANGLRPSSYKHHTSKLQSSAKLDIQILTTKSLMLDIKLAIWEWMVVNSSC